MVHNQFWLAVPVYLRRRDPAASPKKSAESVRRTRHSFVPFVRPIHFAELFPLLVAYRALRLRSDVQRHV